MKHILIHGFQMAAAPGFAVALQHSSMHCTRILCKLLCVSKAVRSVVLQQCVGQLPLCFSLEDGWEMFMAGLRGKRVQQLPCYSAVKDAAALRHLGSWIGKYGRIMKSLMVHSTLGGAMQPMIAGTIATSLLEAARSAPLQLQSLQLRCNDAIGLILSQLSPHHLTQLDIHWESSMNTSNYSLQLLSQLTGLRQLSISRSQGKIAHEGSLDPINSSLAPLTNLTMLSLKSALQDWKLLHKLSQQLQEVELQLPQELFQSTVMANMSKSTTSSVVRASDSAPQAIVALQLAHLTAVTSLTISGAYSLNYMDTLPVNLKVLKLCDCSSCQPLLSLQQLQQLSMYCSSTSAQELQQLSTLGTLTHISLTHVDGIDPNQSAVTAASYVWVGLPSLSSLNLQTCFGDENEQDEECCAPIETAVLQNIARTSSLSELCISNKSFRDEVVPEMSAALLQLTALTALELRNLFWCDDMEDPQQLYGFCVSHVLLGRILELPMLRKLSLSLVDMDTTTTATTSVCAQPGIARLTSLFLHDCLLTDVIVQNLLASMGDLQSLTLSCNKGVTGATAPAIAALTQLTSLHLQMANMQLQEIQCLTCLHKLVICDLPGSIKCWWISPS